MGRYLGKILFLLTVIFLFYGCSSKKENSQQETMQKNIRQFTFRQFAEKTSFILTGESAEIGSNDTSVKNPSLSLKTATEMIEITTGKEGKGQFDFIPETKSVNKILFTGNIKILYKNLETGKITMEGHCKKLTYLDSEKMLVMEGSPVLKSGSNIFSGDIIYYNFKDNTLKIEGSVNVQIPAD